jgi:hypothetical protein
MEQPLTTATAITTATTEARWTVVDMGVRGWTFILPGHTPWQFFTTEAEAAQRCAKANEFIDCMNDPDFIYDEFALDT